MKDSRFLVILAVIGPGVIAGNAGNDAGGIATYSIMGAKEGYGLLWALVLMGVALAVIQEMSSRMGVVTGKGFGDLVREQFGVRVTMAIMLLFIVANLTVTIAEFAGIAASMELFGVSKYISVPISAFVVWLVVVKGNFKQVERFMIAISMIYLTYVVSGIMADPPWKEVLKQIAVPHIRFDKSYFLLFITMVGTTITPYMQFYLQSAVVDKGVRIEEYRYARYDVYLGSFMTIFIAFFIVLATGTILHPAGVVVDSASDAARALEPHRRGEGAEAAARDRLLDHHPPSRDLRLAERVREVDHGLDAGVDRVHLPEPLVAAARGERIREGRAHLVTAPALVPLPASHLGKPHRLAQRLPELRLEGTHGLVTAVAAAEDPVARVRPRELVGSWPLTLCLFGALYLGIAAALQMRSK